MRLRERSQRRLTTVFLDSKTLKQNSPAAVDFKDIVIQRTLSAEQLTADHLLLYVRRWDPAAQTIGAPTEVAVLKSSTMAALRAQLGAAFGIDASPVGEAVSGTNTCTATGTDTADSDLSSVSEANVGGCAAGPVAAPDASPAGSAGADASHLRVCKPFAYQLKDVSCIAALDWTQTQLPAGATVGGAPWRCRSGDTLLVKDARIPERYADADRGGSSGSGGGIGGRLAQPVERELRIFSLEDQARGRMETIMALAAAIVSIVVHVHHTPQTFFGSIATDAFTMFHEKCRIGSHLFCVPHLSTRIC